MIGPISFEAKQTGECSTECGVGIYVASDFVGAFQRREPDFERHITKPTGRYWSDLPSNQEIVAGAGNVARLRWCDTEVADKAEV
jgi:hypothetical protein